MLHASHLAAALALLLLAAGDGAAQQDTPRHVTDPLADFTRELPMDNEHYVEPNRIDAIYRVTRDYNNDGRRDTAFTFVEECGNGSYSTGCSFRFYLSDPRGGYTFVGALDGSVEFSRLEPVRPGVARMFMCRAARDREDWIEPVLISASGFTSESIIHPTPEQDERLCYSRTEPPDYTYEQCAIATLLHTGQCVWFSPYE